ncbi:hypothetical protein [Streptomyces sp. NBC_01092]|uniref:hypothetical protein n=1 Tax=Streptomyces sp. NBC_01092 TaxID=2903748 RepID=UPI00386989EC|nr:hypothetical protein OG254_14655 [Streptomyces sp. NBC_01092]
MTRTTLLRLLLAAPGLAAAGFGIQQFVERTRPDLSDAWDLTVWLGGAVVLHDGLLVPAVLLLGLLIGRSRLRPVLRGGLLTGGCLTLLALPLLLRPGSPKNPTVLPRDYWVSWSVALVVTAVVTGVVAGVALARGRRN